jgi:hypothetical protein
MDTLLRLEELHNQRLESDRAIEAKRAEFEIKKLELEMTHAVELAEARKVEQDAKVERRKKAREYGLVGAHNRKVKAEQAAQAVHCAVCANPNSPALTAPEIDWHHAGHPQH